MCTKYYVWLKRSIDQRELVLPANLIILVNKFYCIGRKSVDEPRYQIPYGGDMITRPILV